MCFPKNKGDGYGSIKRAKTAKKDIEVYKHVERIINPKTKKFYKTRCRPFYHSVYDSKLVYIKNKLNKTEMVKTNLTNRIEINEGFHSEKGKRGSNALFIIPKGSKYYENKYEYVSNQIIFKRFLKSR